MTRRDLLDDLILAAIGLAVIGIVVALAYVLATV